METREQVEVSAVFPAALWEDVPVRDAGLDSLRQKAAVIAAGRNMAVVPLSAGEIEVPSVLWMRFADGPDGKPVAVECSREQAEVVKVRLAVWATDG